MARAAEKTAIEMMPVEQTVIELYLTPEEAETLAVIVAKVAGDTVESPRRHADSISSALANIGIHYRVTEAYRHVDQLQGIRFNIGGVSEDS